ncbi:Regenerating islet-derived protein 4, partial [Galemys pyrenaicus]
LIDAFGSHIEIIMRPSCAAGWFYHKSHCYGYFRKMRTWSDAELECQSQGNGAHLASILSLEETTAIAKYITRYQKTEHVWIGLYDAKKVTSDPSHRHPGKARETTPSRSGLPVH